MLRTFAVIALALFALVNSRFANAEPNTGAVASRDMEVLRQFPPPGTMIDIGGRKLHLFCKGESHGQPTVILETGAIASSLYYWRAQDEMANVARVCVYDRAGLGWSDPAPLPRSLQARADDLHVLLQKAGLRGPYVLVGHSMGGLLVRFYVHHYPKEVAGVVLVESSEEQYNGSAESLARVSRSAAQMGQAVKAADAGIDIPQLHVPNAPPQEAVALRASVFRAGQDDLAAMSTLPDQLASVGGLGSLGNTPLVIIHRGLADETSTDEQNAGWLQAQQRLAALSTRSETIVAERSGHNVQASEPELYAEAVKRVMQMQKKPSHAR